MRIAQMFRISWLKTSLICKTAFKNLYNKNTLTSLRSASIDSIGNSRFYGTTAECNDTEAKINSDQDNLEMDWERWEYGRFNRKAFGLPDDLNATQPIQINRKLHFWDTLTDDEVIFAMETLQKLLTAERRQKFDDNIAKRTNYVKFVFENPSNANNVWAALRTLDAFGIQFTDIILEKNLYYKEWRRFTMKSALGTQKWLTLTEHNSTLSCVEKLRNNGYRIMASDLNPDAKSIHSIDWNSGKVAIIMGNEDRGISEEMRKAADETFYIPMKGFAESLNLASASAVTCTVLECQGALKGRIPKDVANRILLMWMARTVSHSPQHLRRAGLSIDNDMINTRIGEFTTRP